MQPTQTFFTNGEGQPLYQYVTTEILIHDQYQVDPWLSATIGSQDSTAPKRVATQKIPAFNQAMSTNEYFGIVHKDNVHAQDMVVFEESFPHAKTAFNESLLLFASALKEWLKNYEPQIQAGSSLYPFLVRQ
jgi:hypothetical protein